MRELTEVLKDWEAVIGLEIHTELTALDTKMFCGCKLSHDDAPNTNVCPVCLGMPGALPVPNRRAIESIVKAGLATNCEIQKHSMFYRKHYFYPDMAKNFVPIRILRIHMEEDAAKMVHVGGEEGRIGGAAESLIDYNRCGTPLIELVTEPDLRTPEEARLFMEKLRRIFLTIGISDCSMEKGSMRCDGNVSIRRRGETGLGTKTELKNLNSFKALHDGLAYEICRQAEVLEEGGTIYQETRHWEPSRKRTVVMRVKETADDYRLFPDPDLAPFDLSDEFIEHCRAELPELPDAKRDRFEADFGIKRADAEQLAGDPETAEFFEAAAAGLSGKAAQTVANLVVNELAAYLKGVGVALAASGIAPAQVASLAKLLAEDAISSNQAHEVFEAMAESGDDPAKIVDERGMRQVSDTSALQPIVDEILAACSDQAQQYRDGNQKVIGFLVGQCMKASRGTGNPKLFNELLRKSLS